MRACASAIALALLIIATVGNAEAQTSPGIDCKKAAGEVERAICADPALTAQDHDVSNSYALLAGIAGAERPYLILVQRAWLASRDLNCANRSLPWEAESVIHCLTRMYKERQSDLRSFAEIASRQPTWFADWLVRQAYSFFLDDPHAAEVVFRAHQTLQAKLGLALVLQLASNDPKSHEAEISRLLAEVKDAPPGDGRLSVDLSDGYDGSVESMVPFVQATAGQVVLPCRLIEKYPSFIVAISAYFYSSQDAFLPTVDCSTSDYPVPVSVDAFAKAVNAFGGGAFDRCTGTMRSGFAADFYVAKVKRMVLPRLLLAETPDGPQAPDWVRLGTVPLERWSYNSAWNRAKFLQLKTMFFTARADLASYYQSRFGLPPADAVRAAHFGLWQGLQDWTWRVQPPPSPLAVAIMDKDAAPSLSDLLHAGAALDREEEPVLSLAVVRPAAIAPLLAAHADVNAANTFGKTPLMTAAQFDSLESLIVFLIAGTDVNAKTLAPENISGNSPLSAATPWGGCGDYAISNGERTALMYAAANGSLPVIKALLAAGADRGLQDSQGKTALDYLLGNGPVPANSRLSGAGLVEAKKLLAN